MEGSIRRRAILYGVSAVLIALILATLIYYYPSSLTNSPRSVQNSAVMRTFSSSAALENYLIANATIHDPLSFYQLGLPTVPLTVNATLAPWLTIFNSTFAFSVVSSLSHSSTNIQVLGIDEPDVVKADSLGFIYVISGTTVSIVKAYPAENAEVVSKINYANESLTGLFVSGNRMAVLGNCSTTSTSGLYNAYELEAKTFVDVYDISNRSDPKLLNNFTITGNLLNSRMIGDYVYVVTDQPAYLVYDTLILPKIYVNGDATEIAPTDVHYVPGSDQYYLYTTFFAFNMQDASEAPTYLTVLMGKTSNMYMSTQNIYITFQTANNSTMLYRLQVKGISMTFEAKGVVPGQVLNQLSMDEYNGYFRLATSTWNNGTEQNNIYVLNMSLDIVGKLENLAPGNNLISASFMDNRGYLVTSNNTDPLFVIDLSQPTNPTVLGQLKIPAYLDYIYPYDETHLIGVGWETTTANQQYSAWNQGVIISLFDVNNVTNPVQEANYTIGDRGSSSPILSDPKSFLFDASKHLLVIPVLVADINETQYPNGVPQNVSGNPVWQGVYVFNVTLQNGFALIGNGTISHLEAGISVMNQSYWVTRSLYIENVLYTISDMEIKMNSLQDLSLINEISLS